MHSHPDLVQKLQMLSDWEDINSKQDVIQLLTKTWDLSHKHDETKQGMMALMEAQHQMFLGWQKDDTLEQMSPMAGSHSVLYKEYLAKLKTSSGIKCLFIFVMLWKSKV